MHKKQSCIFTILLLLLSCQSTEKPSHIDNLFDKSKQLTLSDVNIPTSQVPSPFIAGGIINNNIVIVNMFGDKLLSIFDLDNNYTKTDLINRGNAKNEMISIIKMSCYDDNIYVYGAPNKLLTLDSKHLNDSCFIKNSINVESSLLSNIIPIEGDYYAGIIPTTDSSSNLLSLTNTNFSIITSFGPLSSYDLDNSTSHYEKLMGLQGKLERSNDKKSIVYTSNFGSVISFYTQIDNTMTKVKEYIFQVPKFKSNSKPEKHIYGVGQSGENIYGTISLKSDGNHCYLLYTDKQLKDKGEYASNVIYVFDFKGSPVKKYMLNENVNAIIGINKNNIYFYGSNTEGEPIIKKATL